MLSCHEAQESMERPYASNPASIQIRDPASIETWPLFELGFYTDKYGNRVRVRVCQSLTTTYC